MTLHARHAAHRFGRGRLRQARESCSQFIEGRFRMVMNLAMELPPSAVGMCLVARDSTNGNMGTADLTPTGEQFHYAR